MILQYSHQVIFRNQGEKMVHKLHCFRLVVTIGLFVLAAIKIVVAYCILDSTKYSIILHHEVHLIIFKYLIVIDYSVHYIWNHKVIHTIEVLFDFIKTQFISIIQTRRILIILLFQLLLPFRQKLVLTSKSKNILSDVQ